MPTTVTQYIPLERFAQFHEILCSTGGRYLRNPFELFTTVEVHYAPGDYAEQCRAWERCLTPIREVRRVPMWRRLLERLNLRG